VADDTGYQPSNLGGAPPAPTYAPSPLPGPPGSYGPQIPPGVTITPAQISKGILSNESGGNPNVRTSPQGAVGIGQILPATAKPYMRPGESLSNPADNLAIHNRIIADYAARWPNDPARVAVAYFSGPGNVSPPGSPTPWIRNTSDVNESVAKYVANATAKMGGPAGGTAIAASTPTQPGAPAAQQAGIGAAIAALNAPTGGPGTKSTADNLSSMAGGGGGGGGSAPPPLDLQAQQAAAAQGNARQMMLAQQGAQLAAALRGAGGARGSPGPASTMAYMGGQTIPMPVASPTPGAPQPPGTTLNSTGGLYG
jgi:Transglycosylase SLT domain